MHAHKCHDVQTPPTHSHRAQYRIHKLVHCEKCLRTNYRKKTENKEEELLCRMHVRYSGNVFVMAYQPAAINCTKFFFFSFYNSVRITKISNRTVGVKTFKFERFIFNATRSTHSTHCLIGIGVSVCPYRNLNRTVIRNLSLKYH